MKNLEFKYAFGMNEIRRHSRHLNSAFSILHSALKKAHHPYIRDERHSFRGTTRIRLK